MGNSTQSNQQQKSSLEVMGLKGKEKPKEPEMTAATAAERHEAGSMEAKTKSLRGQAGVSLENLEQRANERNYSAKSAQEINGIKLNESPEKQRDRMDSLYDVSAIMLANLFYQYPNTTKELDVGNFDNVGQLASHLAKINPRSAESAALYKLTELSKDPNSEVTKAVKAEWPKLIRTAQEMGPHIKMAMDYNPNEKLKDSEKWSVKGFIHDYPKTAAICGIAGAIGGFFAIRGIWRLFSKSSDKAAAEQAPETPAAAEEKGLLDSLTEAPKGFWGKLKWILGGGLILAALGSILKFAGVGDWIKKIGGSFKDGLSSLLGEDAEFKKDKEFYKRMASRIGKEMVVPVDPKFLAEKIGQEKFNDFAEDDGWFKENLVTPVLESDAVDGVAKYMPGVYTRAQRKQAVAVRTYLKGTERQAIISKMTITDETTVVQVLAKVDEELNKKEGIAPTTQKKEDAKETAPAVAAGEVEQKLLPYLKSKYGEISPNELRDISTLSYANFTSKTTELLGKAGEVGSELGEKLGLTKAQTVQETALNKAKDIMRRFLDDKKSEIVALGLPASASIGAVLTGLVASWPNPGESPTANPDASATATAVAAGTLASTVKENPLSNEDIEGTQARDEAATELEPRQQEVYMHQRKLLADLIKGNEYVKNDKADELIKCAESVAKTIGNEALKLPEADKRNARYEVANRIELKIRQLKQKLAERTQKISEWTAAIKAKSPLEELFLPIKTANDEVADLYSELEGMLAGERSNFAMFAPLAMQLARISYIQLTSSAQRKAYVRQYYGILGFPTAKINSLIKTLQKSPKGIALAESRVELGQRRLQGDLGGADVSGAGSLEQRANLDTPLTGLKDDGKQARERYNAEKTLLTHDEKILAAERELENLKEEARVLRKGTTSTDTLTLKSIESKIAAQQAEIRGMTHQRIKLEHTALQEASDEVYGRLRTQAPDRALTAQEWAEMDDLAERGSRLNRDRVRMGEDVLQQIKEATKRGAPKAEIEALQRTFNENIGEISKTQKGMISSLGAFIEFVKTSRAIKTTTSNLKVGLTGADTKRFRNVFGMMVNWQKGGMRNTLMESVGASKPPLLRVLKGKFAFYGLSMIAAPAAIGIATKDSKTSWTAAAGQGVLDMAPITGTISDFATMVRGRELISGREVVGYERWLLRPAFGVVGLASDVLLIAGVGAGVRAGVGALRGGMEAARLAKLKGAVSAAAKTAGEALAKGGAKKGAGETAEGAAEEGSRLWNALRKMDKYRMPITIGLGVGVPVALMFTKQDEMEIPQGIKDVVGSDMQELDLDKMPGATEAPSEGDDLAAAA
ncbi:MAG: hypothetical protein WCT53_00130 [Candidatus Gracilibacteria bacterium]